MNKGLLKLVVVVAFSAANVLLLSKCYSATIPITKTPLYKHLMKMYKTTEPEKQESERQQKQQEKAEALADKARESSNELTKKPVHKSEEKPIKSQTIMSALNEIPDLSALHADMTFSEAIDVFRNSTEPPLNIIVLWRDIETNSDVDRYTPIGMEPISGVSLGRNLELMLMAVSSAPGSLGYIVEKGTIIVGTRDSLPRKKETRIYDVTDLLGQPANYFIPPGAPTPYYGMPYGGANGGYGYRGYGMQYGGYGSGGPGLYGGYDYGGPSTTGGYGTRAGRTSTGTSQSVNPYNMSGPGYRRGMNLVGVIETHTSRRRP